MSDVDTPTTDDVLRCLFEQGVPVSHLLAADRALSSRSLTSRMLMSLRKTVLVKPGRSQAPMIGEVAVFVSMLSIARRRRQEHLARLKETGVVLAGMPAFRTHRTLVGTILGFLGARPRGLKTIRTQFFCLHRGCKAVLHDAVSAVDHIVAEHTDVDAPTR